MSTSDKKIPKENYKNIEKINIKYPIYGGKKNYKPPFDDYISEKNEELNDSVSLLYFCQAYRKSN